MKVAVLLDGGYVRHKIGKALRAEPTVQNILKVARACVKPPDELFRIYYYDCSLYEGNQTHPLTKKVRSFRKKTAQHERLAYEEHVAYRAGNLAWQGWRLKEETLAALIAGQKAVADLGESDFDPTFNQKGVDMRIGLDTAWLASNRIVEKIVLVTSDHDFIPAMKFARREGVLVTIATIEHEPAGGMKCHADLFYTLKANDLGISPSTARRPSSRRSS